MLNTTILNQLPDERLALCIRRVVLRDSLGQATAILFPPGALVDRQSAAVHEYADHFVPVVPDGLVATDAVRMKRDWPGPMITDGEVVCWPGCWLQRDHPSVRLNPHAFEEVCS
jgi:hypothetical protein